MKILCTRCSTLEMLEWNKKYFLSKCGLWCLNLDFPLSCVWTACQGGDQQSSGAACNVKFDWFNCSSNTDENILFFLIHNTGRVCSLKVSSSTGVEDPEHRRTWQMVVWTPEGWILTFSTDLSSVSALRDRKLFLWVIFFNQNWQNYLLHQLQRQKSSTNDLCVLLCNVR